MTPFLLAWGGFLIRLRRMNELGVGILGFGTVGAGVAEGLQRNAALITQRTGLTVTVRRIADLDIESDRGVTIEPGVLTTDASEVIADPNVHVVVETIGGTTIAKKLILEALAAGKAVVTANKALLAEHGAEIFPLAAEKGVDLYYEASVAGGIPIIKALREGLVGNQIERIYGIMNGTCNYILTRMENEGIAFDEVLAEAQKAGYAEADPGLDIDGGDTAHKAVLLASLAFGKRFHFDQLYIDGIRGLDGRDVKYAAELGYRLKLLAVIKPGADAFEVRVHPALIPSEHMLAKVSGAFNAVLVRGDVVGETLYYGQGAGRLPTASAVIADIVDVARNLATKSSLRVASQPVDGEGALLPVGESVVRNYLRFDLLDQPGTLGKVTSILAEHNISIASFIQKEREAGEFVPVVVVTHESPVKDLNAALIALENLPEIGDGIVRLIVEDLD